MGNDNKSNSNKDNHATTQILVFLCMLICLVSLWFSINTYYMIKNSVNVENDRVNRTQVTIIDE